MVNQAKHIPISVIGLGNMGAALASTLLRNGYPVTVWNRTSGKADRLISEGAVQADTIVEAIRSSQLLIICVSTYEVMHTLLGSAVEDLKGRILVNLTTGTPQEARSTGEWADLRGIHYLDGAIMATPSMISRPETLIFYGGEQELYRQLEPILTVFGEQSVYLGKDPGVPLIYDMALLTMLYGSWYSYLHAQALLRSADISTTSFLPYATSWLQYVIAPAITDPQEAEALDAGQYATDESNLLVNKLALDNIIRSSRELRLPAEWLMPIQQLAAQKVDEGYGDDSFTRIFEVLAIVKEHITQEQERTG